MKAFKKGIALGVGALILAMQLMGCSSSRKDSASVTIESAVEQKGDYGVFSEESVYDNDAVMDLAGGANSNDEVALQLTMGEQLNRKIIKTGDVYLETQKFTETVDSLYRAVEEIGGFIQNASVEGNRGYHGSARYGELTARIPSSQFDQFINRADQFGNVLSKSMNGEDITDNYIDTETRLKSLLVQQERLLALLEKSGSLEELFAIETEYANVSYQIERLKGTLNKYDSLVDYATVNIRIDEVVTLQDTTVPDTFGQRIVKTWNRSIRGFVSNTQELFLVAISLLPYLVVLLVLILVAVLIIKKTYQSTHKKTASDALKDTDKNNKE